MVVDRSGIHRAHKLDTTLEHYHSKLRFHFLPAHCGHHRNPIEGFLRVMKDTIGAGRCFGNLQELYQRTRRVLMAHQERPIYAFHWLADSASNFAGSAQTDYQRSRVALVWPRLAP